MLDLEKFRALLRSYEGDEEATAFLLSCARAFMEYAHAVYNRELALYAYGQEQLEPEVLRATMKELDNAVAAAQDNMRRIARAVADVRPLVGELDMLAFDSASDVYGYALEQSGVNPRQYSRQAWRGMVDMLRSRKSGLPSGSRSPRDAAPARLDGAFAGLNTISIAD